MNKISFYLLTGTLLISTAANAAGENKHAFSKQCFSFPAVAMTPSHDSVNQKKYKITHERVYHANNKTGTILLYGPIAPWKYSVSAHFTFSALYVDPDGRGKDTSVKAELRFVGDNGIKVISTLDSNNFANGSNKIQTMSNVVRGTELTLKNGFYVVRMYVNRSTQQFSSKALGYRLCSGSK
ncbi:MAG: hypothetical protein COA63_013590 [Methylophaga sp.]|nr:hypothetical protein [Methylophaga sp.]